jgi:integrase/recombinase XerD
LEPYLNGRSLSAIDGRLVAEIIRERSASGITSATVKRDLVALSSVLNFAIDQGWCDDNPVLPRLGRIKERRDPIVLPQRQHIDLVISRCPGMIADIVRVAMATGARENELLEARRDGIDHDRRQMTIIGKRNKRRVIDLNPFGAHDLLSSLVPYAGRPLLFWQLGRRKLQEFRQSVPGYRKQDQRMGD